MPFCSPTFANCIWKDLHAPLFDKSLLVLYWFLLLSTNIKVADTIFDIYLKVQSFQSNRSLISGVLLTTGTIQYHKRSKTQKAKVKESKSESGHIHPKVKVATFTKKHMKDLLLKNLTGSSSSHPPLRPLLFSSLAPSSSLLTEALDVLKLLQWATSWPLRARPPTFIAAID